MTFISFGVLVFYLAHAVHMTVQAVDVSIMTCRRPGLLLDWKSVQDIPTLVDDYVEGRLKLDELITQSLPLDQINQAFDTLRSGEG